VIHILKRLLPAVGILFGLSAGALGDTIPPVGDVTITFSPMTEVYPPGADTTTCNSYGVAPCVDFYGTITDTDTDGSLLFLTGITLSAFNNYFTVDNTFSQDVAIPGGYEGDALDSPFPNSYSGVIMGLDFAPDIPVGTYAADAIFAGAGGTDDPDFQGFTVVVPFSVIVSSAPEPATGGMAIIAGLLAIAASLRHRRSRIC
jgi:hypothetical protein